MSKGSILPFFVFLVLFLFSLLSGRRKKKQLIPPKPVLSKNTVTNPALVKLALPRQAVKKAIRPVAYEVERKKENSLLKNTWKRKDSLKQAFILSEVLKKVDEREFF